MNYLGKISFAIYGALIGYWSIVLADVFPIFHEYMIFTSSVSVFVYSIIFAAFYSLAFILIYEYICVHNYLNKFYSLVLVVMIGFFIIELLLLFFGDAINIYLLLFLSIILIICIFYIVNNCKFFLNLKNKKLSKSIFFLISIIFMLFTCFVVN